MADLARHFDDRTPGSPTGPNLVGERYGALLEEMAGIVEHQWNQSPRRGLIQGFLLSGPPGTGKTTLGKALAYEACRRQSQRGESAVLAIIDGSEIARARYGESEARLREIFERAAAGFTTPGERTILLFDDVESVLMARGAPHAKEWHFSQDSTFFHAVDNLDSRKVVLVLTTNRPDLVDAAIRDRFLEYVVGHPGAEILVELATQLADPDDPVDEDLPDEVAAAAERGEIRTMRDAERLVLQHRIQHALGRPSLAENFLTRPT